MPINSSGPIALGSGSVGQSINLELGKAIDATISMNDNDVRILAGKVGINPISFSDFYGKPVTPSITPSVTITPTLSSTPAVTPSPTITPTISLSPSAPTIYQVQDAYIQGCSLGVCFDASLVTITTKSALTVGRYYFDNTYGVFLVDSGRYSTTVTPDYTLVVTDITGNQDTYCCA